MRPRSDLFLPPPGLSACLYAAIWRDTRGAGLRPRDRLNHFPASPLCALSFTVHGTLHILPEDWAPDQTALPPPLPRLTLTPPQPHPTVSYAPADVAAISVGFFPEAWARLTANGDPAALLERCFSAVAQGLPPDQAWDEFCAALLPLWQEARGGRRLPEWTGLPRLADWSRGVILQASLAGTGRSLRSIERRIRRLTGQSARDLAFYARIDALHRLSREAPDAPLAEVALEAGFSDQSHMGRDLRRATGHSPAQLNRLIETEESFWCYRLLGAGF